VEPESQEITVVEKACLVCGIRLSGPDTRCPADGAVLVTMVRENLVGTTLADRYQIVSVIGEGGMGVVYKARHMLMDRTVAIKTLHAHLASDEQTLRRFQREAKAASGLEHPNLITVYDFGVTPKGQPYLVLSYLQGTRLADVLDRDGHLPIERAVNIFIQACDGLAHAHSRGVIHRDLKPTNIMLIDNEERHELVKIVDFGIAKVLASGEAETQELTRTGEVFGSPLYMSPEQCQALLLDARSDIYSLGCVLYEALSGQLPFCGDNVYETMGKHVNESPRPFREVCPELEIPEEIEAVVFATMEKEPNKRLQSMSSFKEGLQSAFRSAQQREMRRGGAAPLSTAGKTAPRARAEIDTPPAPRALALEDKPWRLPGLSVLVPAAACAVALAVAGAAAWFILGGHRPHQKQSATSTVDLKGKTKAELDKLWSQCQEEMQKAYLADDDAECQKKATLAVRIAEKFGRQDPRYAKSLNELGIIHRDQGDHDQAEKLLKESLELRRKTFGENSLEVADSLGELAVLYRLERQLATAESLARRALTIDQKLAPDDTSVAADLNTLAMVLDDQRKHSQAARLLVRSLALYQDKLGESDSHTLEVLNNLGRVYEHQGKLAQAEKYFRQTVAICEQHFGPNHAQVSSAAYNLAQVLALEGKYSEAEALCKRATKIDEARLGPDDPGLAMNQSLLAQIYHFQGRFVEAESLYQQALSLQEKALEPGDKHLRDTIASYAELLRDTNREKQAAQLESRLSK